jgi:DNA-binding IscR family transcriptional regulator
MQKILNITEKTNVVIHSLALIAAHPEMDTVSVKFIAASSGFRNRILQKCFSP